MERSQIRNYILSKVTKQVPSLPGLRWTPILSSPGEHEQDCLVRPQPEHRIHFSEMNHTVLRETLQLVTPLKCIVEIGVDYSGEYRVSSTATILNTKPDDCIYIGVDIENKSYIEQKAPNVHTIRTDSANRDVVYKLLDDLNISLIDFMFVDGWHSAQQVLQEWLYWERMSLHAAMVFHDINYHPGPIVVLDAIDDTQFDVKYYGREILDDWGIGVVRRKL